MLVKITELSHNGDRILYEGPASLSEINDLRRKLSQVDSDHAFISFVIQNYFLVINMNKVKGISIDS